ncbi:MAG: ATP-binding protein [Pseudomonadota bacterium]
MLNVQDGISGYLARMDLFKACGLEYDNNFKRHDQTHNLVEICVLDKRADVDPLAKRISDALVGRMPEYDPEAEPDEMTGRLPHESISSPLAYIFNELLENALTHGRRAGYRNAQAWVAAQYYPSKDLIRLAVLDNGCGFLESLRKHPDMGEESHLAATRLALLPRVTCNPDLEIAPHQTANQGIGLTVVRDIVSHSRGVMRLVSGDCLLKLSSAPRQYESRITPWQGVILSIEFKRDPLRGTNIRHIIQAIRGKSSPRGLRFE